MSPACMYGPVLLVPYLMPHVQVCCHIHNPLHACHGCNIETRAPGSRLVPREPWSMDLHHHTSNHASTIFLVHTLFSAYSAIMVAPVAPTQ